MSDKNTDYSLDKTPVVEGRAASSSKRGHKCCGGCCDVRRAVIIVNIINACFLLVALLGSVLMLTVNHENIDDDALSTRISQLSGPAILIAVLVELIIVGLGIYGAMTYNMYMVGICGMLYALQALLALLRLNLFGVLVPALYAYPHFFLVQEIRSGIMSADTYKKQEEHSCCCV